MTEPLPDEVLPEPLPGTPGAALEAVYGALSDGEKHLFRLHLLGGTSAEWLSATLTKFGHTVSASTLRTYRRSLQEGA